MQWTNYSHLIHRWSVLSKYATHVGIVPSGSYKAGDLVAPITANIVTAYNADAAKGKSGPNEKYIDSADFTNSDHRADDLLKRLTRLQLAWPYG